MGLKEVQRHILEITRNIQKWKGRKIDKNIIYDQRERTRNQSWLRCATKNNLT